MLDSLTALLARQGLLAQQGGLGDMLVPILLVGLIFYFIAIRPGMKERKQREAQLKALKKHDKVVTNAGIHGVVVALDEETVTLRVDDKNNVRVRFSRSAVWQVVTDESGKKGDKQADKKAAEPPAESGSAKS